MENRGKKLANSKRLRIRALLIEKRSIRDVAKITGVSSPTVQAVKNELYKRGE